MNPNDSEDPQKYANVLHLSRPITANRAADKYETQPWETDGEGGAKISMSGIMKAAWTVLFGLIVTALTAVGAVITAAAATIVTAINAVTTAIGVNTTAVNNLTTQATTIATEQTAIRKQGQGRMLTAGAFALTTGTTVTLASTYNKIVIKVCNRDTAVADMEIQHTPTGGTPIGYLEDNPTFPASTTLEYIIPGAVSGDKFVFIGPTTMKFLMYGSVE